MSLTVKQIAAAQPGEKPRKLSDGRGLFLYVTPHGGRWWRFRYRFEGKERLISLGVFPDVGLKGARERREEARRLLACGVDPSSARKAEKAARAQAGLNSIEAIAREWFAMKRAGWRPSTAEQVLGRDGRWIRVRVDKGFVSLPVAQNSQPLPENADLRRRRFGSRTYFNVDSNQCRRQSRASEYGKRP